MFWLNKCVFPLLVLLSFEFFCHVPYPVFFWVMFSWLPYCIEKLFSFSCIRLLVCFRAISPYSDYYYYYYYYYYYLLFWEFFSVSRWFLTGVWEAAILLNFPGLFTVFWPILIILESRWSLLFLSFSNIPDFFTNSWEIISLVLITVGITITNIFNCFSLARSWCWSLISPFFSLYGLPWRQRQHFPWFPFFRSLSLGVGVLQGLEDPFASQNHGASHSPEGVSS